MSGVELSIWIVSYNTRDLTLECLESVFRTVKRQPFEVIVVDNASSDGSADAIAKTYPQVTLIASDVNLGFARANNRAHEVASGEWMLLLNPDTIALEGAIDNLLAFAKSQPGAGIVGGRTLCEDGALDPRSGRGRPTPWSIFCQGVGLSTAFRGNSVFDTSAMGWWRRDSVRQVDIISGCFLLIPRTLWEKLGGFDPDFFMYGEDTDLCLRARALGYRPMFTPTAEIVHRGAASEPIRAEKLIRLFAAHALLFRKHWSGPLAAFGCGMLWLWAATRSLGGALLARMALTDDWRWREWREEMRRRQEWLHGFRDVPGSRPKTKILG